jgi:hypothetical protein
MRLGIDFGTTRTVVSLCDGGNHPIIQLEDGEGELHEGFPSVLASRDGELCFGFEALSHLHDPEWSVVPSFKRLLGAGNIAPLQLGTAEVSLFTAVEGFLRALIVALRERSNLPAVLRDDPVIEAIIATPAHADSSQRFVTLEASRAAGFVVVGMMNEPSAAGVEYASRYRSTFNSKRERVLVYDLGGGTFDASLVDMSSGRHDVVASAGLPQLGGDDFDALLMEMTLAGAGLPLESLSASSRVRLQLHCREQKEGLHPNTRRLLMELGSILSAAELLALGLSEDEAVIVRTDDYYQRCRPLIEQTLSAMAPLLDSLPMVGRLLKEAFGRRVHRSLNPTAATAVGLARAFAENSSFTVFEKLSRSFGVFREGRGGEAVTFDLLFDAQQALPEPGETISLVRRYRPAHNIGRFRYVECSGLDSEGAPAGDVSPLGEVFFPFDPSLQGVEPLLLSSSAVQRLSEPGPLVEERYTIDEMGIVQFEIKTADGVFSLKQSFASERVS